jgi:hypothetical protein
VENSGYGGSFAAPIAGMCMEQYLYGKLIRFDQGIEVERQSGDSADVAGNSITDDLFQPLIARRSSGE